MFGYVDPVLYGFFIAATIVLIATPGPIVSLIIAETLNDGPKFGIAVAMGAALTAVLYFTAFFFGFAELVSADSAIYDGIRYGGAMYLLYLAFNAWRKNNDTIHSEPDIKVRKFSQAFIKSLLIALSSPKVILFFAAFFPQFISPKFPYTSQLLTLGVSFLFVSLLFDSLWVVFATWARSHLLRKNARRTMHRVSASVLGIGAILLLFLNP